MNSIRGRLMLWIMSLSVLALICVGFIVHHVVRDLLILEHDRGLLVRAEGLASLTEFEIAGIEFEFSEDMMPAFSSDSEKPEYFWLRTADGESVEYSGTLEQEAESGKPDPKFALSLRAVDVIVFRKLVLPDGRPGRLVEMTFLPRLDLEPEAADESTPGTEGLAPQATPAFPPMLNLVVARGTEDLEDVLATLRATLIMSMVGLLLAMMLLVRFALSRGLAPLDRLVDEVATLDEDHLHLRVSTPANAMELEPVALQLNATLDRIEEAFERERSFSGNVAHELRTPIAELRSFAEVGRKWPKDTEMVEKFFGELISLADDMERTVVNLMMLARLESGEQSVDLQAVRLHDAVHQVWQRLSSLADRKQISLEADFAHDLHVMTDPDKLMLVLINLLSNAISHSPEQTVVALAVTRTDGDVELRVSNDAVDLIEADLPHIFDRFWRKDAARQRGRHVGLGLSIVKALTEVLDLTIRSRLTESQRFEVCLAGFPVMNPTRSDVV